MHNERILIFNNLRSSCINYIFGQISLISTTAPASEKLWNREVSNEAKIIDNMTYFYHKINTQLIF